MYIVTDREGGRKLYRTLPKLCREYGLSVNTLRVSRRKMRCLVGMWRYVSREGVLIEEIND